MNKSAYFPGYWSDDWPDENWLERFFLTPEGRRDFFSSDNDSWGLTINGVDGTGHLPDLKGRVDVDLTIQAHRDLGILLFYHKKGTGRRVAYYSKGDLSRLHQCIKTAHDDLMPIGLFIPFETAWKAIKEFMDRDGALPTCIPWVAENDLPDGTFPPPQSSVNHARY